MTSWVPRRTGVAPTPAPTSRHSERTVLDEATRPSAPEPAREVAFGGQAAVGAHLVQVHDHYRAELARVRQVLDQVRAGAASVGAARSELNAMTIRANDWTLGGICQAQCVSLTQHHELESDGIFPHLRRAQPDLADVLDRLHGEHQAIHEVLREVDAALVHLVTSDGDYGPIVAAVDLLTDTLQSHFAYEERELIAPLDRHGMFPGQV
ncbi:MAG: hemerythrin domain-containing protein [Actinomycetota bacterium]